MRLHAAIRLFAADLDEKNRRRLAGLLALAWGYGGVERTSRVTGLSHTTIERGRGELESGDLGEHGRVRAPGGGRPRAEKKGRASSPRSKG